MITQVKRSYEKECNWLNCAFLSRITKILMEILLQVTVLSKLLITTQFHIWSLVVMFALISSLVQTRVNGCPTRHVSVTWHVCSVAADSNVGCLSFTAGHPRERTRTVVLQEQTGFIQSHGFGTQAICAVGLIIRNRVFCSLGQSK